MIRILLLTLTLALPAQAQTKANQLFGAKDAPSSQALSPIGSYAKGCAAGNVALPESGPTWQASSMELTGESACNGTLWVIVDRLVTGKVDPARMLENLNATRGLVFSGQLLLALTQKGVSREDAYLWAQRNAMRVWDEGGMFRDLVLADADIAACLTTEEIARVFSYEHYLRNVGTVLARVF